METRPCSSRCTSFPGRHSHAQPVRGRIPDRGLMFFSGFGTGIAQSTVFISLQAAIRPEHKAAAASGLFLTWPIGMTVGLAAISATMLSILRKTLTARLIELGVAAARRDEVRSCQPLDGAPNNHVTYRSCGTPFPALITWTRSPAISAQPW